MKIIISITDEALAEEFKMQLENFVSDFYLTEKDKIVIIEEE